jgi:hypothetical protein
MQLLKPLMALAAAFSISMSAPVSTEDIESHLVLPTTEATMAQAPRCGYVRMNEGDGYIVGVYSRDTCEPIYNGRAATIYRIDTAGCTCKFFS